MNNPHDISPLNGNGHLHRNGQRPLLSPAPSPAPEEDLTWGSIVPSKRTYSVFRNPAAKPTLNKTFILATAYGAASDGLERVTAYHRYIYQEYRGHPLPWFLSPYWPKHLSLPQTGFALKAFTKSTSCRIVSTIRSSSRPRRISPSIVLTRGTKQSFWA